MANSETAVFSVRVPLELQQKLDNLAENIDRSRNWVVGNMLERYVGVESEYIRKVKEGLAQAKAGLFVSEEEVDAFFRKYDADDN